MAAPDQTLASTKIMSTSQQMDTRHLLLRDNVVFCSFCYFCFKFPNGIIEFYSYLDKQVESHFITALLVNATINKLTTF